MKTWARSNVGNQNDNSLFFTIIVESKENIEKWERVKNYRKQKWQSPPRICSIPWRSFVCHLSVVGGALRVCGTHIAMCFSKPGDHGNSILTMKTSVLLRHSHDALKVYWLKPGCSCSIHVICDWVLQLELLASQANSQAWEVLIYSGFFCKCHNSLQQNQAFKILRQEGPLRSLSSEIASLLKVIWGFLFGFETNNKPNMTLVPGQRAEKSRLKKRSKRKLKLAP